MGGNISTSYGTASASTQVRPYGRGITGRNQNRPRGRWNANSASNADAAPGQTNAGDQTQIQPQKEYPCLLSISEPAAAILDSVAAPRVIRTEAPERPMPFNPGNLSGMCEAQRIDLIAAIEGRITWRQYFENGAMERRGTKSIINKKPPVLLPRFDAMPFHRADPLAAGAGVMGCAGAARLFVPLAGWKYCCTAD